MKLQTWRTTEGDTFTEGKFFVDEVQECYTVEDTDRHLEDGINKKVYGKTAIPRGIYPISITYSNRFKKDLILIEDVPGFTGVRIHSGNSSKDTEGCIIVGSVNKVDDDNWVGGSRIAYDKLHRKIGEALDNGETVTLEIV